MNMLRAGIIAQRVDVAQQLFPGVAAAALFIGTVGAAGGKLLVDTIQHLTGDLKGGLRRECPSHDHQNSKTQQRPLPSLALQAAVQLQG
jgi:hypothetical protein